MFLQAALVAFPTLRFLLPTIWERSVVIPRVYVRKSGFCLKNGEFRVITVAEVHITKLRLVFQIIFTKSNMMHLR